MMLNLKLPLDLEVTLKAGDKIELERWASVIEDDGDIVKFRWKNGDENWVWKINIKSAFRWVKVDEKNII